ncbi:hypothetical protein SBV1_1780014 [Verrucomicrobia bacterium]|nr:hypothetical protein SBV1_1780014 [Verrucomicrobiota bacterium]
MAQAQSTQPVVAIHDSELTRALELVPATGSTPTNAGTTGFQWWLGNWHYFVMPDSIEEALRSDGTAFVVLSDAQISAGALLTSNGSPAYPIFISLAAEAVRDDEIAPLTNYVAAGGTLLAGGSAFTRTTNGTSRGDFAIADAMGIHSVNSNLLNWGSNYTFSKTMDDPLVSHIPGGSLQWDVAVAADEIPWGISPVHTLVQGHLLWLVEASDAQVIARGDAGTPYLATKPFGRGKFIYEAGLQPLIGHGGNAPAMYAYGIFRNAIQEAFAAANLPVLKLSPWPFAYDAALSVRHDLENLEDQINSIAASAQFEFTNGAKGDYHFCTGTLRVQMTNSAATIAGLQQAVSNYGATIGPENGGLANPNDPALVVTNDDYWHWGPDEALDVPGTNLSDGYSNGAAYAFASISNSFGDVEGWLGGLTNGLRLTAAPYFNATREGSYQIEQQLGVNVTGEQKIGPFPSWVLSTSLQTPDLRYPFISLPTCEWFISTPNVAQDLEDGYGPGSLRKLVDFYYSWGALINLYSHSSSAGGGFAGSLAPLYVTYSLSKPRIWAANAADLYRWWVARSDAQVTVSYSTNGSFSSVNFGITDATDSRTAVEALIPRPSVASVQVVTNGVLAGPSVYRTNGPVIKVLVGTSVTNAQVTYLPAPQVQASFYTVTEGEDLSVVAPGVLVNALRGGGTTLTAIELSGPSNGTLSLTNNGSFNFAPAANFTGIDSFTYQANDGLSTSSTAIGTVDVTPPGSLFFDNFQRATNADPLAPWVQKLGNWTISGGQLQGTGLDTGTFSDAIVPANWTNYSVQAQVQFPPNAFAGGLDGRVNPASGAKYTVNVYPNGFPGETTSPLIKLWKFHSYQILSSAPLQEVVIPPVGTNWHTLQVAFQDTRIVVFFDGVQVISTHDNEFDGLPAYTNGGIGAHFYTYVTPYVMTFQNVQVTTAPLAVNDNYSVFANRSLSVSAPGVLANDSPGLGTNLTAVLLSGPSNGTLMLSNNGGFTYTPAPNYVGSDSFSYEANDGATNSGPAVVTITVLTNTPPVANNAFYYYQPNTVLTVPAPGLLTNDTAADGESLTATLVQGPAQGTLSLSTNGGFTYIPSANYTGNDGFAYVAQDSTATSAVAFVTLQNPTGGALFYDNFSRATNPGPLLPWVAESGAWTVAGGTLQGGLDPTNTYGNVYLTNSWTDYAVSAQFQFTAGAYGGGLGGRLNPVTGAHYAVWIYPAGNDLNLVKFGNWTTPTSFLATRMLPPIGTGWHQIELAFRGNQIAVYYDGSQLLSMADTNAPLTSGGVSVDMYTAGTSEALWVENVLVAPLAVPIQYSLDMNTSLTVPAPGVLNSDTGVFSTNLTAMLVSGVANGTMNLSSNGGFTYTPTPNFFGQDSFVYQASDNQTNLGTAMVTLTVINPLRGGPSLPLQPNLTVNELTTMVVTNTASDSDTPPPALSYELINPPAGAAIDTNGIITWTPSQAQAPSTNIITTAVSDHGFPPLYATNSFVVIVNDLNSSPVLPSQANQITAGLATLVVTNTATEPDIHAVSLTYLLATAPPNAIIDANGIITWTPVVAQVPSSNLFTTVVTDYDPLAVNAQQMSATNSFWVVVNAVHNGPRLPIQTTQTINELSTLVITNTAIDNDVPVLTLTYQLINPPDGANINANGIITWTPSQAQAPSTNILTTVVTDSGSPPLSATNSFTVVVNVLPGPVLPFQTNRTVAEFTTLHVNNAATDPQSPPLVLTYRLLNGPPGGSIDPSLGIISWVPVQAQGPTLQRFTTAVSDNGSPPLSATNSFLVGVIDSPPALPFQGPQFLSAGETLHVINTASDPGILPANLSYQLLNAPTNAAISSTGVITWTPVPGQVPSTNVFATMVTAYNPYGINSQYLSSINSFLVTVFPPGQPPIIESINVNRGLVTLTWSALTGATYRAQYRNRLTDLNWNDLAPDVTAQGSSASITDTPGGVGQRFYRVVQLP